MRRREFLTLASLAAVPGAARTKAPTQVSIQGDRFFLNGKPTYAGRSFQGKRIDGLLLNARMIQGIYDDLNPETRSRWAYPDTGKWDAERNTREFIAAMAEWRAHGLLSFTINLQGGSPEGYSRAQPWENSAIAPDGSLRADYMARLEGILHRADELGMAPIVGLFYFGQDQRVKDEAAIKRAVENTTRWILERGYRNVLLEIANECDVPAYDHAILKPPRVHELIALAQQIRVRARRLLVSVSFGGGRIPTASVVAAADYLLLHGNGVAEPARIAQMVAELRMVPGYRPKPILFNEDDHFAFDQPANNMLSAIGAYASWGYFDPGKNDYTDGYQSMPVNWGLNTERKRAFFALVRTVTGA